MLRAHPTCITVPQYCWNRCNKSFIKFTNVDVILSTLPSSEHRAPGCFVIKTSPSLNINICLRMMSSSLNKIRQSLPDHRHIKYQQLNIVKQWTWIKHAYIIETNQQIKHVLTRNISRRCNNNIVVDLWNYRCMSLHQIPYIHKLLYLRTGHFQTNSFQKTRHDTPWSFKLNSCEFSQLSGNFDSQFPMHHMDGALSISSTNSPWGHKPEENLIPKVLGMFIALYFIIILRTCIVIIIKVCCLGVRSEFGGGMVSMNLIWPRLACIFSMQSSSK